MWRMVEDVGGVAVLVDLSSLTYSQGGGVLGYVWLGVHVRGGKEYGLHLRTEALADVQSSSN